MKDDMLEVLMYLFENYMIDGSSFEPGQEELANELICAGFADTDVDKAFIWLEELLLACEQPGHQASVSWADRGLIRFYSPEETERLQTQGKSLLARLLNAGLLDQHSHETVVDRIMALDSDQIELDHIQWVVLMVLSNRPGFAEIAQWAEVVVSEDLLPVIH